MYIKVILKTRELIENSEIIFSEHLSSTRAFKRCKKLSLSLMFGLLLKGLSRSLQIELVDCLTNLEVLDDVENLPSKSAFSQSRCKIEEGFFKLCNKHLCEISKSLNSRSYSPSKPRRVAVDGSILDLPQTLELEEEFGCNKNQHGKRVLGRFCFAEDIDQEEILLADLAGYNISEKAIALPFLNHFGASDLLIYDQYYYGFEFCYRHIAKGILFLMRVHRTKSNVIKAFVDSDCQDQIIEVKMSQKGLKGLLADGFEVDGNTTITLRFLKGKDDEGNEIYYVTNLLDNESFTQEYCDESYHGRWKVETAIDVFKNKLQVEHFAGHSPLAIKQEFHAGVCQYNLVNQIYIQANEELYEKHPEKRNCYKVNRNLTIGLFNLNFFTLFLDQKEDKALQAAENMINILVRFPEPIRLGRKFPRKYKINKRKGRCYTQTNYRRAA